MLRRRLLLVGLIAGAAALPAPGAGARSGARGAADGFSIAAVERAFASVGAPLKLAGKVTLVPAGTTGAGYAIEWNASPGDAYDLANAPAFGASLDPGTIAAVLDNLVVVFQAQSSGFGRLEAGLATLTRSSVRTVATAAAPITAFAQNGSEIAWADSSAGSCPGSDVRLESLPSGRQHQLADAGGATCAFGGQVGQIAVSHGRVLWVDSRPSSSQPTEYEVIQRSIVGRSAKSQDKMIDSVSASSIPAGTPFLQVNGSTFVWADPPSTGPTQTTPAAVHTSVNGRAGVVPGLDSTIGLLAEYGNTLALSLAASPQTIELRNATTGALEHTIQLDAPPSALALDDTELAVVTGTGTSSKIEDIDVASGLGNGSLQHAGPISAVAVAGGSLYWVSDRMIFSVDNQFDTSILGVAGRPPTDLSVTTGKDGTARISWTEGTRIRSITD